MPLERPYPGQLWNQESPQVIVVAVHPNLVTYEFLSGGQRVTQSLFEWGCVPDAYLIPQ